MPAVREMLKKDVLQHKNSKLVDQNINIWLAVLIKSVKTGATCVGEKLVELVY